MHWRHRPLEKCNCWIEPCCYCCLNCCCCCRYCCIIYMRFYSFYSNRLKNVHKLNCGIVNGSITKYTHSYTECDAMQCNALHCVCVLWILYIVQYFEHTWNHINYPMPMHMTYETVIHARKKLNSRATTTLEWIWFCQQWAKCTIIIRYLQYELYTY